MIQNFTETAMLAMLLLQLITVILLITVIVKMPGRIPVEPKKERSTVDDELNQVNNRLKDAERQQERIRRNYDEAKTRDRNRDNREVRSNPEIRNNPENRDNRENRDGRDRDRNRDNRDNRGDRGRDGRNFRNGNRPDNRNFDRDRNRNRDNRDLNRPAQPAIGGEAKPPSGENRRAFSESKPAQSETPPESVVARPEINSFTTPAPVQAETPAQDAIQGAEVEMEHGRRTVFKRRPLGAMPEGGEKPADASAPESGTLEQADTNPPENKENTI